MSRRFVSWRNIAITLKSLPGDRAEGFWCNGLDLTHWRDARVDCDGS